MRRSLRLIMLSVMIVRKLDGLTVVTTVIKLIRGHQVILET